MPHAFKFTLLPSLFFILLGCASPPKAKVDPVKGQQQTEKLMRRAEMELAAGKHQAAEQTLQKLIKTEPGGEGNADANLMLGRLYYEQQKYQAAYDQFMMVAQYGLKSPQEAESIYWAALCLYKLGRYDESIQLSDRALDYDSVAVETRNKLQILRFRILNELGDRLLALRSLVEIGQNDKDGVQREKAQSLAREFVEAKLTIPELEVVAAQSAYGSLRPSAMFYLGRHYFEQHEYDRARDYFSEMLALESNSSRSDEANSYLVQINSRRLVDPKTIGVVLPLSGKQAPIAYKVLRGIQLGLGIYGQNPSGFRLAVVDSEGNADKARRGVERLVTEDHCVAIIGSLLSKTASAVASKANDLGVPSIGLSQRSGLTDHGSLVFRNALTSQMQVRYLVQTAMERYGHRRFAILFPNDPYGQEFAQLFWDEVERRGGTIQGAQPYPPGETDFRASIQRLVGTHYIRDRQKEYNARLRDWEAKQTKRSARQEPPDDLLPPVVDFDAIFIPDNTRAVGQIAPMLAYTDVDGVALLGTNLWNSNSLIERGNRFVEGSIFVDGLLATDEDFLNRPFVREFRDVFGEDKTPGVFEVQGYDSALLLRTLIAGGATTRAQLGEQLAQTQNLPGALGTLTMTAQREIERPLLALTVDKGNIRKLEAAALK